jgi:ribosomal protein L37AE/L43A
MGGDIFNPYMYTSFRIKRSLEISEMSAFAFCQECKKDRKLIDNGDSWLCAVCKVVIKAGTAIVFGKLGKRKKR